MIENPFLSTKGKVQHLSCKHFIVSETYHVELIQPLKATVLEIKQKRFEDGAYLMTAVEVIDDHQSNIFELNKGSHVIMDFPVRTFERALIAVSRNVLRDLSDCDNVRIRFRKDSKQSIFIFELERMVPTEEQKLFADKRAIKFFAILISAFVFVQVAYLIFHGNPSRTLTPDEAASVKAGTIQAIGQQLYTNYIIPFEVAGFLLLAATIGAMVLAKKKFE